MSLLPKKPATDEAPLMSVFDFNRLQGEMVGFHNATTFEERDEYRKRAETIACEASAAVARALIARRSVVGPSVRNFTPRPQAQRGHRAARRTASSTASASSSDADPAPDPPAARSRLLAAVLAIEANHQNLAVRLARQALNDLGAA